jgi:hypothetical protein
MHDLFSLGVIPDSIDPSFWSWDVMRMLAINGVKVSHHMMEDFSVKDDTDNFRSLGLLDFAVYLQEKCRRLDVGGVRKLVANGGLSMIHGVAVFEIISSVDRRTPVTRLVKRARAREIIQLLSDNFDQCIKDL